MLILLPAVRFGRVTEASVNEAAQWTQLLINLHKILTRRFDIGELRTLCMYLGISYEEIEGEGITNKARELLAYAERHNRISDLILKGKQLRQDIPWNDALEATNNTGQEPDESVPDIRDPLSLLARDPDKPMPRFIKQDVVEARTHSNWKEVIRICNNAMKMPWSPSSQHLRQTIRATTLLYRADAQAQRGYVKKAIRDAERAVASTGMKCDASTRLVAHLLLARFTPRQNRNDRKDRYECALNVCEELESQAKEKGAIKNVRFYARIAEAIRCAQIAVDDAQLEEKCRSCLLNSIPILQLSEGPPMLSETAERIGYLAADEFEVEVDEEILAYVLYPLDAAVDNTLEPERRKLELKAGTVHFALPVPENGWPNSISKPEDFALVQAQSTREGPGVRWTGQQWEIGQFERDERTGNIRFAPSKHLPYIMIGEITEKTTETQHVSEIELGSVIGLLKPSGWAE